MGKKERRQKKRKWVKFRIPKFLIPKDEPIVSSPFNVIDYAGGILVFFICWIVYQHTLTPTIGFHDSGDMITAAYVLGIPHPTGYPLYCLLGKLWMTILPIGNIAYRMNLASALCASLACMMVYFIILKLTVNSRQWTVKKIFSNSPFLPFSVSISNLIPAIVGALMLAFATTFWEQAVIAEKYTLNALFATLLIFILLKWHETILPITDHRLPTKYLYLFAFTLGLSFTHHMQTIYLLPASILFIITVYWQKWRKEKLSLFPISYSLLKMLCLFILPMFLYLYLPICASLSPDYNWGDPQTLKRFIAHISGQWYKSYFVSSLNQIYENLFHIPYFLSDQFTQYFWWISLIGLFFLLAKRKIIGLFFIVVVIINLLVASRYSIRNIEDYYFPLYIIFSITLGLGIIFLNKFVKKRIIFSVLFFGVVVTIFLIHYPYNNKRDYYFAYDYGCEILSSLDKKAIIFLEGDRTIFPVSYLKYCENRYPEVALILPIFLVDSFSGIHKGKWYDEILKEKYPDIDLSTFSCLDKISPENVKKIMIDKIISDKGINRSVFVKPETLGDDYFLIPKGIFCKVIKKETGKENLSLHSRKNRIIIRGITDNNKIFKDPRQTLEIVIAYLSSLNLQGFIYFYQRRYQEAIEEFKKVLKIKICPEKISFFIPYGNFYNEMLDKYIKITREVNIHLLENYYLLLNIRNQKEKFYLEAIDVYKKALEMAPNNSSLRNIMGCIYSTCHEYQLAITEFKEALKINPVDINCRRNLATAYYRKGLLKHALQECNTILKIDPGNVYVKEILKAIGKK
ncbi:MAG: DUF2723 domain-containing protein [bacterium]